MRDWNTHTLTTPDGATIEATSFGSGPRALVFIPGVGDGLATATQLQGRLVSWLRERSRYFRVLYVSRRAPLYPHTSVSTMAADVAFAMRTLSWHDAIIEAQSAGGPVGIQLAVNAPDLVRALALSSTTAYLDETARAHCDEWLTLIGEGQWAEFFESTAPFFWRPTSVATIRPFLHLLTRLAAPADSSRLEAIFETMLRADVRDQLAHIPCPTLVTGGRLDRIFPEALQTSMAAAIPQVTTVIQPDYGHGNDMENPAHVRLIAAFARMHVPASLEAQPA